MIAETRRVRSSAAISMSFHVLIFGLYLLLRTSAPDAGLIIAEVEMLDLQPEEGPPAYEMPAARQSPASITDFLKMALPKLKQDEPLEAEPQDVEQAVKIPTFQEFKQPKMLVDKGKFDAKPSLELKTAALPASKGAARLTDMAAQGSGPSSVAGLSDMDQQPSFTIEEVGATAVTVGGGSGPMIRIDPNAEAKTSGLADMAPVTRSARPSGPVSPSGGGIKLMDTGPVRRTGGRIGRGKLPYGYGRGAGGGISLATKPIMRVPKAAVKPAAPTAKEVAAIQPQLSKKLKAVEIVGPLAKRKVVRHYLPQYPGWAKEKGVEAEVMIRFFVSSEGRVRDRLILERTSGYPEMDKLCMQALRKWLFASLPTGGGDQWGIITFRFRLK